MKSFFVVMALSLAACAPVAIAPQPDQSTTKPSTAPPKARIFYTAERVSSGTIRLALDNGSSQPIGYNLCPSELQRRSGSGWTRVPVDKVCTMQLLTLNPGHDATFEKLLPAGLPSGKYRYVTGIENPLGTPQVGLTTDPFSL